MFGRIFNSDWYGGYLTWMGYPRLRPFVDGRQANLSLFADYILIRYYPKKFWPTAEKMFQFDMVMVDASHITNIQFLNYLAGDKTWQLVSLVGNCVLFVKRGRFSLPEEMVTYEERLRSINIDPGVAEETLKKFALSRKGIFGHIKDFLFPPVLYSDLQMEGVILFDMGYREAGLFYLLKDFEITRNEGTGMLLRKTLDIIKKE
jgi:hypothetical protein